MSLYETKIIGGVTAGIVLPSALGLEAADFSDEDLGHVFRVAAAIERDGAKCDPDLVASRLAEIGDIAFYSASDFRQMAAAAQSASVVHRAAEKVKAVALKSYILQRSSEIGLDKAKSGAALLDELKRLVAYCESEFSTSENAFVMLDEIAPKVEAVYDDLHRGVSYAVPTGFAGIDRMLGDGFSKGDLHVIVGMTGHGKSALALNYALHQARAGRLVGIVSREMSDIENVIRLQAADAGIPRWHIRSEMFDNTRELLRGHLASFRSLPLAFDTRSDDIETIRVETLKMVETKGMEVLYVDYLQLLTSKNVKDTRALEVQTISRELKKLAMETGIPVVALCQFNNGVTNATMYDAANYIRESGSIKQDASTIQYIQVEHTDQPVDEKDAKLTILKNRNGETFRPIGLRFRGAEFRFSEAGSANPLETDWSGTRRDLA